MSGKGPHPLIGLGQRGVGSAQPSARTVVPLTTLIQRLERSLRVSSAAGACGIIGLLLVHVLVVPSPWLLGIVTAAVLHQAALVIARRLCRRGEVTRAAVTFCLTDWVMVVVALLIVPAAAPALVPIIIARVVTTLLYLDQVALMRLVVASVAAGVLVGALSRVDLVGVAEQVPGWVVTAFVVFFVPVGFAIVGLDLWQHSATLLEIARGELEANARLRVSQRVLAEQAEELHQSRSRLVAVADAERRRLERDLHDGAQQTLTGLCLAASQLARRHAKDSPVRAELARLEEIAQTAVTELRELAHGVYPPVLASQGLAPALEAVLRQRLLPVRAVIEPVGRRSPEQEAAVYFCCREALQNIEKHAATAAAEITLTEDATGALNFSITDTGRGFDTRSGAGHGLINMRDRLAAVGGDVAVRSSPGGGTVVTGRLPPPNHPRTTPDRETAPGGSP